MIQPHQIQALKAAADLPAIARSYAKLRRVGDHYMARCCFHQEKTASLAIWRDRYVCFGCNAKGDAIGFLINVEGWTFQEAAQYLADLAGVSLDERKVSKRVVATAAESAAFCEWWWQMQEQRIEDQKAPACANVEPEGTGPGWDWLETVAGMECKVAATTTEAKWKIFRNGATDDDRAAWKADIAWEQLTADALLEVFST